jgi:hypothetical protein
MSAESLPGVGSQESRVVAPKVEIINARGLRSLFEPEISTALAVLARGTLDEPVTSISGKMISAVRDAVAATDSGVRIKGNKQKGYYLLKPKRTKIIVTQESDLLSDVPSTASTSLPEQTRTVPTVIFQYGYHKGEVVTGPEEGGKIRWEQVEMVRRKLRRYRDR